MLLFYGVLHLYALAATLADVTTPPASPEASVETVRDEGYAPTLLFAPGAYPPPASAPALSTDSPTWSAACYSAAARKTYFSYVAADQAPETEDAPSQSPLRVSCYDHSAGTVPKPAILPLAPDTGAITGLGLILDDQKHLWVVASFTGGKPSVLFKSTKPGEIGAFVRLAGPALSDMRIHHVAGHGFLAIGLKAEDGHTAPYFSMSPDALRWSEPRPLAAIDFGHSFVTSQHKGKVGVALTVYAAGENPLATTNVYYLETPDGGKSWQNIRRTKLELPVRGKEKDLLAWEYRPINWTVRLKDLNFDGFGNPTVLYLNGRPTRQGLTRSFAWTTARWIGREWETTGVLGAAGAFDSGLLQVEPDRSWRLLIARNAPIPAGPHEDIVLWSSEDQGRFWQKLAGFRVSRSDRHALIRPADAQPDLYALWVSGEPGGTASPGRLVILNRDGDGLLLPARMTGSDEKPRLMPATTHPATQPR